MLGVSEELNKIRCGECNEFFIRQTKVCVVGIALDVKPIFFSVYIVFVASGCNFSKFELNIRQINI